MRVAWEVERFLSFWGGLCIKFLNCAKRQGESFLLQMCLYPVMTLTLKPQHRKLKITQAEDLNCLVCLSLHACWLKLSSSILACFQTEDICHPFSYSSCHLRILRLDKNKIHEWHLLWVNSEMIWKEATVIPTVMKSSVSDKELPSLWT